MTKIVIKLPVDKNDKFRLQRRNVWKARRFLTASGLLGSLERSLNTVKMKEKTSLVVKRYVTSSYIKENHQYVDLNGKKANSHTWEDRWVVFNESCDSANGRYLLWCASCFLEDCISANVRKRFNKTYGNEQP